ncbi:MAG: VCBS repeat-containing protein [Pyrinomonadaceae bacterium]|nr:VCBS repeat-containing protein [Pyrinomonadaceae bacterium]
MTSNYRMFKLILILMCGLFGFFSPQLNAKAATLTVNTNVDTTPNVCDGTLSLREAMLIGIGGNRLGRPLTAGEQSMVTGAVTWSGTVLPPTGCSASFGPYRFITSQAGANVRDDIIFATNVTSISLISGLPNISWAEDVINGLKSDGTKAAIDGTSAGNVPGLRVYGGTIGFTIRNLIIRNFALEGLLIQGSSAGVFEGLEIFNNGLDGIALTPYGSSNPRNNRVGGTNLSQRNFIHSNGRHGILIAASTSFDRGGSLGNVIENNFIGLRDNNGNQDRGNAGEGIFLDQAFGNRIGGDTSASRNVISGNSGNGILLSGDGCYANLILNNFIGTNKDSAGVIGNDGSGIALQSGAGDPAGTFSNPNIIGDVGKGNVIAGSFFGVGLFHTNTDHNIVRGNFIGTDLSATRNLGNVRDGVFIEFAHDNLIGGTLAGEENVIAFNRGAGVFIMGGAGNSLRRNRIFLNTDHGIDLSPTGIQPNDSGDADTGPNNFQNFPIITGSFYSTGTLNVTGTFNSTPSTSFALDLFVDSVCDASGNGEGRTNLGVINVTTDGNGNATFNRTFLTGVNHEGFYVTATATDPAGNTSEFSQCRRVPCSYSISPASQSFSGAGGSGSVALTISGNCDWMAVPSASWISITGGGSGTGNGYISYNVAANTGAARTGTITVGGRTHTISQAAACSYMLSHASAGYSANGTNADGVSVMADGGCPWSATSSVNWITITSGSSGSGNGTVMWSVAPNSCGARQGFVNIAGQTFTITQASITTRRAPFDFDGDGKTDIVVFRPNSEIWYLQLSCTNTVAEGVWGWREDKLVPADYDGDGITDFAIWRPSEGNWYLYQSRDGIKVTPLGQNGDIPVPADYDGDGKADLAVYRDGATSNAFSYFHFRPVSGLPGTETIVHWGLGGDRPVPADYDGDGKADLTVFRPSDRTWYRKISESQIFARQYGNATDKLVPGDYDGDGKADIAVYHPEDFTWYILQSRDGEALKVRGEQNVIPVPGDYDGDGKWDVAVWRLADGWWSITYSTNGMEVWRQWGWNGDIPIPSIFVR